MKDFFRWFHICWCAKCVMKKQRHHFVDLSKDVSWSSHGGLSSAEMERKVGFYMVLPMVIVLSQCDHIWSYLIYLDLDRDLPLVDAAGVFLISWKKIATAQWLVPQSAMEILSSSLVVSQWIQQFDPKQMEIPSGQTRWLAPIGKTRWLIMIQLRI